jgi:hypothetical protein
LQPGLIISENRHSINVRVKIGVILAVVWAPPRPPGRLVIQSLS